MKVDGYEFGKIVIDGRVFDSDVLVLSGRVVEHWWRKEGHRLDADDLGAVVARRPRLLIVGTGMFGMMKVPEQTKVFLRDRGIEVKAMKTKDACAFLNETKGEEVAAAFHLTC